MKSVKVAYANIPNVGDLLNKYIIEKCFNVEVEHTSNYLKADVVGIGSSLGLYQKAKDFKHIVKQMLMGKGNPWVWGTGFMYSESNHEPRFWEPMHFAAVRGKLSLERVEKIINQKLDIPVCDGGILTSYLLDNKISSKRYEVGVIPHYKEQDEPAFKKISDSFPNSILINLRKDPLTVIQEISQCEYILSSSLHGLIMADSFNIPNMHIFVSNKMMGDGFKFADYYSAFDLKDDYWDIKKGIPDKNDIIDNYRILSKDVDRKKQEMMECFPYKDFIG